VRGRLAIVNNIKMAMQFKRKPLEVL